MCVCVLGVSPYLSLSTFLQWEDVRQMLEFGAITEDELTQAIQSTVVHVEDDTVLTFDEVELPYLLPLLHIPCVCGYTLKSHNIIHFAYVAFIVWV